MSNMARPAAFGGPASSMPAFGAPRAPLAGMPPATAMPPGAMGMPRAAAPVAPMTMGAQGGAHAMGPPGRGMPSAAPTTAPFGQALPPSGAPVARASMPSTMGMPPAGGGMAAPRGMAPMTAAQIGGAPAAARGFPGGSPMTGAAPGASPAPATFAAAPGASGAPRFATPAHPVPGAFSPMTTTAAPPAFGAAPRGAAPPAGAFGAVPAAMGGAPPPTTFGAPPRAMPAPAVASTGPPATTAASMQQPATVAGRPPFLMRAAAPAPSAAPPGMMPGPARAAGPAGMGAPPTAAPAPAGMPPFAARGPPATAGGPPVPGTLAGGPPTGGPPAFGAPQPNPFGNGAGAGMSPFGVAGGAGLPAAFAGAPDTAAAGPPMTMGMAPPGPGAARGPLGPSGPSPIAAPAGGGAPTPMAEVNEQFQCLPAYMSFTMGAVPMSKQLADKSCMPMGLCVHPLAEGDGTLRGAVPVVNFGTVGVIRCKKCRAYINPFAKFVDAGRRWKCNLCTHVNDVPPAYMQPLDAEGNRVDLLSRPELCTGSVEFIAPSEYMVRPPQAPVYVFVIDVSYASVSSGMLHTAVAAIRNSLSRLPGDTRTQIGFVTFDAAVHFYHLRSTLKAPQMMVMPDLSEAVHMPVPEELLVNLSESRALVDALLESLPSMFAHNKSTDSAFGPALDAAYKVMEHIGGKMVVLQCSLPSAGMGKLKPRETPKMLGSDKEFTLLAPEPGDDGAFYRQKAVDCSRQQISVDMFLFAGQYTDVATLGALARYTAGQVYFYPGYTTAVDGERFGADLERDLTRTTGFEAVMRVRTTKGLKITNFYGNFFIRGQDLLALPNATCDTAFNVEFDYEELLQAGSTIAFQAALLYTTSNGERRINVHTLCKPVTTLMADIFRGVSQDAVMNMIAKVALDRTLRMGLPQARMYLHRAVVDIVRAFRTSASPGYGPGAMAAGPMSRALPSMASHAAAAAAQQAADASAPMLPDNLAQLPLFSLGLQKSTLYRGGELIRSDERAALVYRMLTMPLMCSPVYAYPRMFCLNDLGEAGGRPNPAAGPDAVHLPASLTCTAAQLNTAGVYVLDDGVETYMWLGRGAPHGLIQSLFGRASLDGLDLSTLQLPPAQNDFAIRVHAILRALRANAPQVQRVRFVREGSNDLWEHRFHWHMVEDRQNFPGGTIAFAEYPAIVLRDSHAAAPPPAASNPQ